MSTYAKVVLGILWAIVIVANIAAGFIPQFKPLPVWNTVSPTIKNLKSVADVLHCTIEELISDD